MTRGTTLALPLFGAELEPELVGGKARGCAALLMLGLPVPAGFILTTAAFSAHLAAAGLARDHAALLAAFNEDGDEQALRERCQDLQARIAAAPIPPAVRAAIDEQAAGRVGPFAVRSSAAAEDSATTAFAGIFHSELGVPRAGLGPAAARCWSHAASHAAITHALRADLDPAGCGLALLVQELVPARRSGALFTRDPVGGGHRAAVIAYVEGLGDGLMQGETAGASATVARRGGRVLRAADGFALPGRLRRRLVRLGRRVERALGAPQDIEWAERPGGGLCLLQARPITTPCRPPRRAIRWTRELSEERFPQPISPLGWSVLQKVLASNVATLEARFGLIARRPEDVARTFGHYVYSNQDFFSIPGSMRFDPRRQGRFAPQHAQELFALLGQLPGAAVRGGPFGPRWLLLCRAFSAFIMPHAREIRRSWDAQLAALLARMDAFRAVDPAALPDEALWPLKLAIDEAGEDYMEPDLAIYVVKIACVGMVEKIGERLEGARNKDFLLCLTAGLEDNRTLLMNAQLEGLFALLRGHDDLLELLRAERYDAFVAALSPRQRAAYEGHLEACGHITTNWDIRVPTWGDRPEHFLRVLRSYVVDPGRLRTFARGGEARARRAREEVRARMDRAPWMAAFFDELIDTLRAFMRIDEEHHFYCSRLYPPLRRLYLEIGARLARRGLIHAAEDVFFLRTPEVERMLAGRAGHTARYLVAARQGSFERAWQARPPFRYLDERPVPEERPAAGKVLRGVGASPGRAVGPVRVVEHPEDLAAFRAGEIMVTASPNPTWTAVYAVAAGLVTSTGSLLSHGLVCAREYELPAVIGVQGVTGLLSTGQRVALDGTEGTVTLDPG